MRHSLIACSLLLGGCWLSDDEIVDRYDPGAVEPDTSVNSVMTTDVMSVEPDFGTNAGEQLVVIEVDVVGDDLTVIFGGESAEIISIDGTSLTVRTPSAIEGAADVVVSSGGGSATLEDGYWFWEDATGAYGTIGDVTYYEYQGDLARLGYVDSTLVDIRVVNGSVDDFSAQYSAENDACQLGARENTTAQLDLQTPDIQLQTGGGQAHSVLYDAESTGYAGELPEGAATNGIIYKMLPFDGAGAFPAFGIDPIADLAGAFAVDVPNFSQARLFSDSVGEDVGRDSFNVEWSQPDAADYVIIELVRWGPNASNTEWEIAETASCVAEDDGRFRIPGSVWTQWSLGAPLDVYVSRVRTTETVLPHNNAINGVVGRSLVGGTVWQALF